MIHNQTELSRRRRERRDRTQPWPGQGDQE